MYKLTITNVQNGYSLDFNNPSSPFIITEILGLDPPDATINIDEYAVIDGGFYNSSKANYRQMQIAFAIDYNASASRQKIYRVLQPGRKVRIDYSDQQGLRVYTEGYVGKPTIDHFAMKQTCVVAIECPESYWQAAESIINAFYSITNMFHFPFASEEDPGDVIFGEKVLHDQMIITNDGNITIGFRVSLLFKDALSTGITLSNVDTGDTIVMTWSAGFILAHDIVVIDTRPNNRSVILARGGVESSIFYRIDFSNSTNFPMLNPGDNLIQVGVTTSGEIPDIELTERLLYEGV